VVVAGWRDAWRGDPLPDAEGRQDAGERVYENPLHACGLRYSAGVLARGATKTKQRKLGCVKPLTS